MQNTICTITALIYATHRYPMGLLYFDGDIQMWVDAEDSLEQYQTSYVQGHQYADMNRHRKFVRIMETNP